MTRRDYLPYCRPALDEDDIQAVVDTLRSGWLTTGPKVVEFEREFARAAGTRHAIALSSCTAGMHVALLAAGVGPGDEVITPSLSFVAGANTIRQVGATPVFCDVERASLCATIDEIAPLITPRTKAVMTMHFAGRPAAAQPIVEHCAPRGIAVIEDAALAVGTLDDGRWPGTRTTAAAFSFYATKNVTTGEGGMVVTDDDAIADRIRTLALHGMDKDAWKRYERGGAWRYDVIALGYKYNLADLGAAIGLGQLRKLDALQRRREEIAQRYLEAIDRIEGVSAAALGRMGPRDRHSWCVFPISIDEARAGISRDAAIEALKAANIGTSVHYIPSHLFTAYATMPHGPLPVTDAEWKKLISLPLFPGMSDDDVTDVIRALRDVVPASRERTARTIS